MRFVVATLVVLLCGCDHTIHEGDSCDDVLINTRTCVGDQVFLCSCTSPNSYNSFVGVPECDGAGLTWVAWHHCDVKCDTSIAPDDGCVSSLTPVPECDGVDVTCWNGERHVCNQGYPVGSPPCSEVLPGSTCVIMDVCGVVCQPPATDPRCPQTQENIGLCDGNTSIFCQCGYLVQTEDCGSAGCHTVPVYGANDYYQQDATCEESAP